MHINIREPYTTRDSIFADKWFDEKLIHLLSAKSINADRFYLTGFETILFNKRSNFAVETILSSIIAFDENVLIVGNSQDNKWVEAICDHHGIDSKSISMSQLLESKGRFFEFLKENPDIRCILLNEPECLSYSMDAIKTVHDIASQFKVEIVLNCSGLPYSLANLSECGVSFMVFSPNTHSQSSVVVAQRSKLVQAEGRSRSMVYDLYYYWQETLFDRKHEIEPMAV